MGVNNYQTILRIELNDQVCYSEHHLMVPEHVYCWVAGSFNDIVDEIVTCGRAFTLVDDGVPLVHVQQPFSSLCLSVLSKVGRLLRIFQFLLKVEYIFKLQNLYSLRFTESEICLPLFEFETQTE